MVASTISLLRMKPSVKKGTWSQSWKDSFGSANIYVTVSRGVKAKTEACTVTFSLINPHYTNLLNQEAPEGETNDQRTTRILGLAEKVGGTYEYGVFSWKARGKNTSEALSKAREALSKVGISVETPERA